MFRNIANKLYKTGFYTALSGSLFVSYQAHGLSQFRRMMKTEAMDPQVDDTHPSFAMIFIHPDNLLEKVKDHERHLLGISTKVAFEDRLGSHFPFRHTSFVLLPLTEVSKSDDKKQVMMEGRQSPSRRLEGAPAASDCFSTWRVQIDNEKYHLKGDARIEVQLTPVEISSAEYAEIKRLTNDVISKQFFDALHSNCYSTLIFGLAHFIRLVDNRAEYKNQHRDLVVIYNLLRRLAVSDNFAMGVRNNPATCKALLAARDIMIRRGLLTPFPPHRDQISFRSPR
jgi:hypothetical protein